MKGAESNLTVGDVALVKNDNEHILQWPLARVIKIYTGLDGITRVVDVKLANDTELKRATVKLVLLVRNGRS